MAKPSGRALIVESPGMLNSLQEFKATLFKAMANPVRIRILEVLRAGGEMTVSEIQQQVGVEPSNVSQHLSILRSHGLVLTQREGTSVRYSVAVPDLFDLLDVARAIFEKQLADRAQLLAADAGDDSN
jgi:DNA-binding transcriptional ArsR family regulator